MKDLFAGFGSFPEAEQENKPEQVNAASESSESNKKSDDQNAYALYAQSVNDYDNRVSRLDQAYKAERVARKNVADSARKAEETAERYYKEQSALFTKQVSEQVVGDKLAKDIEVLRTSPEESRFKFRRPTVNSDIISFFTEAMSNNLMSEKEISALKAPVENVCGPDKTVKGAEDFVDTINNFTNSSVGRQLINCVPTDDYIKSWVVAKAFWLGIVLLLVFWIISTYFIVGLAAGVLATIIYYKASTGKGALDRARKKPSMKEGMLKELFKKCENDNTSVMGMYCLVNTKAIVDYFEQNYVKAKIADLELELDNSKKRVISLCDAEKSTIANGDNALRKLEAEKKELEELAAKAKQNYDQRASELLKCINAIKHWDSKKGATPEAGWLKDNWFGDYIYFANAGGSDDGHDLRIVKHSPKGGLMVLYNAEGRDNIDAMAEAIQRTLSAFDHMIPKALADYAVVDFNMGELGQLFGYDIDWKIVQNSSAGGIGKKVIGSVSQVGTSSEAEEFKRYLTDLKNTRRDYMVTEREKIRSIAGSSKIETRHINAARGTNPFKYQVVIFIPGRQDTTGSSFYDIKGLYSELTSLADSFIPVFLVEQHSEQQGGLLGGANKSETDKQWESIINDTSETVVLK